MLFSQRSFDIELILLNATWVVHKQTGINVKKVMDTWIKQMGLPVVTITRVDQEKARADQKLFLILPGAKPNQSSPFK